MRAQICLHSARLLVATFSIGFASSHTQVTNGTLYLLLFPPLTLNLPLNYGCTGTSET